MYVPALLDSVKVLLRRFVNISCNAVFIPCSSVHDGDDEVRDRAAFYLDALTNLSGATSKYTRASIPIISIDSSSLQHRRCRL